MPIRPQEPAPDLARVRAAYGAGLARVLEAAAVDPRTSTYWPLLGLGEFWRRSVVWAEAAAGGYRPLEPQRGRQAWVAVVPSGDAAPRPGAPLLQVEPAQGVHVLRIRPEGVTEVWAGLFLVHQLAHLADRVLWGEAPVTSRHQFLEAELRARELALAAAMAVSEGALTQNLDTALSAMGARGLPDVLEGSLRLSDDALDALAPPVLAAAPASVAERTERRTFLRSALLLRYGALRQLDREAMLFGLHTLLQEAAD